MKKQTASQLYFSGYDLQQIAEILNISVHQAMERINRNRKVKHIFYKDEYTTYDD